MSSERARGTHWLVELEGCHAALLNDAEFLEKALHEAATRSGVTVLGALFHKFEPQGVSGVLLLSESHLSIHTWPETHRAAVDLYTCGFGDPANGCVWLKTALGARSATVGVVDRETMRLTRVQMPDAVIENGPHPHILDSTIRESTTR